MAAPGYRVRYPNREKASAKATKMAVGILMLVTAALMLIIIIGGWGKLQGLKPVHILWALLYIGLGVFILLKWVRGILPMAAGMAVCLVMVALIAGIGLAGESWFDDSHVGLAIPHTIFGTRGLSATALGFVDVLLIPVQAVLIGLCMLGFSQGWNVETTERIDKGAEEDEEEAADEKAAA